jgi:glycosyltransferase involved in cell wall biosynthesis
MTSLRFSATIITYNEEKNIERCLNSVHELVDEIVVVDSFSTDRTQELCAQYPKVRFIQNPFQGHIEQKNFALNQAQGEVILSLDADEALSPELNDSIREVKERGFPDSGYSFHRRTRYVDQWIWHCGWYPDTKLRIIKKNSGQWQGVNPHDLLCLDIGTPKLLSGDLLHYSYNSISEHINQTNKFTTIAAKAAFAQGQRSSLFKIVTRPGLKFLRDYLWKRGFLDGRYGFVICSINALSALLKYAKLYDLQNKRPID